MSYKLCSARDGNTCETPGSNEIIGHCIDCDCLTLEEQAELANMFTSCPCGFCKHETVQGTDCLDCWDCGAGWDNWEPKE